MARIHIPSPLQAYADGQRTVDIEGATVGEALANLVRKHPAIEKHLFAETGKLRQFVNIYRNEEDIRYLDREKTGLDPADEISIVPSVAGGKDGDACTAPALNPEEIRRYGRHLTLPEFGMAGQRKLKASSVLVVGAGGLGSPLALYLAAAGVGKIGLVDYDAVDETNLQRQILYGTKDVGRKKLAAARERIRDVNPFVDVETFDVALASDNVLDIFSGFDLVADGTDNFPTRYLVNDACVMLGIPNAYASIFRFEGQASVFGAPDGPCYRCLYEEPPPPGLVPSCAEGGVLGVLPGLAGVVQAAEAIKMLTGVGEPLVGRLLLIDALGMRFRELRIRRNPACPVCSDHPSQTELIDYQAFCGIPSSPNGNAMKQQTSLPEITVRALKDRMDRGDRPFILDVRKPHEYDIVNLGGALIPLDELPERLDELEDRKQEDIVVHCRSGGRSAQAVQLMQAHGFEQACNLKGGVLAWSEEIDPSMPTY